MGAQMHATCEPADRLIDYKPYEIVEVSGGFEFRIPAPFLDKSDASLIRRGDELIIRMGAARRNIVLPRVLARMTHSGARLEDGQLRVRFSARESAAVTARSLGA